jgi:hypothetical protein
LDVVGTFSGAAAAAAATAQWQKKFVVNDVSTGPAVCLHRKI